MKEQFTKESYLNVDIQIVQIMGEMVELDTEILAIERPTRGVNMEPLITDGFVLIWNSQDSLSLAYLSGWLSAAAYVRRSMAVNLVCLRLGTNTMTGFLGECFKMAL